MSAVETPDIDEIGTGVTANELAELRLLKSADLPAVAKALEDCPIRTLAKDELLIASDASNRSLYLVLQGCLRVHIGSLESDPVWVFEKGDAAGEMSMIAKKEAIAYIVAAEPTRVLTVEEDTFWVLVYTEHAFARNMLWMMVERLRTGIALMAESMRHREQRRRTRDIDPWTGLRTGHTFMDLLRRQLLRCSMNGETLTCLLIGIDEMAEFKKEFGVVASNNAVSAIGRILQENVRPTDFIGRLDEKHFIVILNESNKQVGQVVARRLCHEIGEEVVVMPDESILPPTTVTIGVVESGEFEKVEDLLNAAEAALERARRLGSGSVSI
jgi:diguanylate cyclase (GGDEF)-like protein